MTERTLNDIMEFDHVIRVNEDGTITEPVPGVHAPELAMETDDDGQVLQEHEAAYIADAKREEWDILQGWSAQSGYSGLVMHRSEYIGGALEQHIRETPGLWVAITVETADDSEDAAGWAIAYRAE